MNNKSDNLDRLLAAGDALADAADTLLEEALRHLGGIDVYGASTNAALDAWRALAREVRKEKGDDAG